MDKRTIWAIVISLAFLFAWNMFFNKKHAEQAVPPGQVQTNAVQSRGEVRESGKAPGGGERLTAFAGEAWTRRYDIQ